MAPDDDRPNAIRKQPRRGLVVVTKDVVDK